MQNRRPHWPSRLPFYYGWVIVGAAFVTMAVGVTARTAFSLLMPPLIGEFHWDRGVAAGAFSFGFLVSALLSPIVGRMIDLRGPRIIIMCGVMLTAAGLHVLMQAASTGRPIAWGLPSTCSIWLLPTQESGINSAGRSPITRVFNGRSLTWRPTCTPAQLVCYQAAWRYDREPRHRASVAAMAKLIASEMVCRVADSTLQLFGGAGYRKDEPIERIWREVRAIRILEGTSEIMRHIVARDMLRNSPRTEIQIPLTEDGRHDHAN